MPKYLVEASYTAEGLKGLYKDKASGRKKAVEQACASLGGKLEGFYYCFGKNDAIVIVDLPDNATAAGFSLRAAASGLVTTRTTVLLTVEEADQALKTSPKYRAPGKA